MINSTNPSYSSMIFNTYIHNYVINNQGEDTKHIEHFKNLLCAPSQSKSPELSEVTIILSSSTYSFLTAESFNISINKLYCSLLCIISIYFPIFVHMYSYLVKFIFIRINLQGKMDSVLLSIISTNYIAISVTSVYGLFA